MAAITSAGSGNWNNTATWTGGAIPVSGDTVTIANGHTVTVPGGYTAACGLTGSISATDYALRTAGDNGTGVLVVAAGGVLEVSSHIRQGNIDWTINGTVLATHTSTRLSWQIGTSSTGPYGRLYVTGSEGARARVGKSGGGVGWNSLGGPTGYVGRGAITSTWAKFEYVGTSSAAFSDSQQNANFYNVHHHTWWDNCGSVEYLSLATTGQFSFQDCLVTNPVNSSGYAWRTSMAASVANSGIIREWIRCDWVGSLQVTPLSQGLDTGVDLYDLVGCALSGQGTALVAGSAGVDGAGAGFFRRIERILAYQETTGANRNLLGTPANGIASMLIGVRQWTTSESNADFWHITPSAAMEVDQVWVEQHPGWDTGTGTGADMQSDDAIVFNNSTVTAEFVVSRAIIAPTTTGKSSGTVLTVGGNSSWQSGKRFRVRHSVFQGGFSAEHGTPVLGSGSTPMAQIEHSLMRAPTSTASQFFAISATVSALPDGLLDAQDNATHNISGTPYAGSGGNPISSGKYVHAMPNGDITGDPDFVDPSRNFMAFGHTMLADNTIKDRRVIVNEFLKRNSDDVWDDRFSVENCWSWMSAGYAPQNLAFKTDVSGDNNGWIGAVPGIEPPTGEIAIAVDPEHRSIVRGATGLFTVALTRTDYTDPVTIVASGLPTGVTASYPDGDEFTGGDTELTVLLTVAADAPLVEGDVWSIIASGDDVEDAIEILTVTVLDVPAPSAPPLVDPAYSIIVPQRAYSILHGT